MTSRDAVLAWYVSGKRPDRVWVGWKQSPRLHTITKSKHQNTWDSGAFTIIITSASHSAYHSTACFIPLSIIMLIPTIPKNLCLEELAIQDVKQDKVRFPDVELQQSLVLTCKVTTKTLHTSSTLSTSLLRVPKSPESQKETMPELSQIRTDLLKRLA